MLKTLLQRLRLAKTETKRPIEDLAADLSAKQQLNGTAWRHRKGGEYRIICIAYREQTLDMEVVYEDMRAPVTYIRPLGEFMDGRFTQM